MGSKPTKTAGSPVASSTRPSSSAKSVGGGRTTPSARSAFEVCAASVRRGIGPTASSPPTSQMISTAWATPTNAPATRSAAPRTPVPSDGRQATPERRADRFADDDRDQERHQDDEGTDGRVEALDGVDDEREAEDDERGTADGAGEAAELRERAGAEAQGRPDEEQHDGRQVDRVHAPIVAQVGRTWVRRATGRSAGLDRSGDLEGRPRGTAAAVGDGVRARLQVAEVDARGLELGDVDARDLARAVPLTQRDRERTRRPGRRRSCRGRSTARRRSVQNAVRTTWRPSTTALIESIATGWTSSWPGFGVTRVAPPGPGSTCGFPGISVIGSSGPGMTPSVALGAGTAPLGSVGVALGAGPALDRWRDARAAELLQAATRAATARRPASRRVVVMPRRRARPAEGSGPCCGWTSVDGRFPASADVPRPVRRPLSGSSAHPVPHHRDRSGDRPP